MPKLLVAGRIHSLEGGRVVLESPLGPPKPANAERIAALIEAARAYQRLMTPEARRDVLNAALAID